MKHPKTFAGILLVCACTVLAIAHTINPARAATLINRSDTVSTSAVGTPASHTIRFTTSSPIPTSGSVVIAFTSSAFVLPVLDYQDVDVLINTIQQPLAATAGTGTGSPWGVTVTSGAEGFVTLFLNDTDNVAAGSTVEIRIGTAAVFQTAGAQDIPNPLAIGSYTITVQTKAANTSPVDSGSIPIAITNPVGISSTAGASTVVQTPIFTPPGGTFTSQVTVSIQTATPGATIYYTTDGTTPTTGSLIYTTPFTLTTSANVQAIAVKAGYTDSAVAAETYTITTTPTPGVVFPPAGPITVSTQGIRTVGAQCGTHAVLQVYFPQLAFPEGSTLTITCLTWSSFPIKTGAENTYALGDVLFGITARDSAQQTINAPAYPIYAVLTYQNQGSVRLAHSYNLGFLGAQNQWSITPTQAHGRDILQFETILRSLGHVGILYSNRPTYACDATPADINCDGSVNIIDMSILMSYWHTETFSTRADINRDSRIDLIDLTILFYWWSA